MDVVWALMAVAASGVTYDWQPVADQKDSSKASGFEYIVQVEPALVEAARRGEIQVIESNVPANLGRMHRVRIVLGGEKSATELVSHPLKRHHVAKPVAEEKSKRHTVRQQVSGGQAFSQNLNNASNQLEQGFREATQGLQNGFQQAGQAAGSARQAFSQPFAAQPASDPRKSIGSELLKGANKLRQRTRQTIRNTGEAIDGSVKNIGEGLRSVVTGGQSPAPAPAPAGSGGFVPFSYGGAPAQPANANLPAGNPQATPAFGANPVLAGAGQTNNQQNFQQGGYQNAGFQNQPAGQPNAAPDFRTNGGNQITGPNYNGQGYNGQSYGNQPQNGNQQPFGGQQPRPNRSPGLNTGDFVSSDRGLSTPPLRNVGNPSDFGGNQPYPNQNSGQQDDWPYASGGNSQNGQQPQSGQQPRNGQPNGERPFVSFADSQNQPSPSGNGRSNSGLTNDGLLRVRQNNPAQGDGAGSDNYDNGNYGNGNFANDNFANDNFAAGNNGGPFFPANNGGSPAGNGMQPPAGDGFSGQQGDSFGDWPLGNGQNQGGAYAGGQPPYNGPLANPANLPPLGAPAYPNPNGQNPNGPNADGSYAGQQFGPNPNLPETPSNQPWGMFVFTSLVCLGSLSGNLFLGWSYLDARNKYQSALRRTVRTFSRGSGDV